MKKCSMCVVAAAILLVLCLPVSALASPGELISVQLYGAELGDSTSASYHVTNFALGDDGRIYMQSSQAYTAVTYFRFRLLVSVDQIKSFQLVISYDGSMSTVNSAGNREVALSHWDGSTNTHYVAVNNSNYFNVRFSKVNDVTTWTFDYMNNSPTYSDFNLITFVVGMNITSFSGVDSGFKIQRLIINGSDYQDIAPTETNVIFEDTISQLSEIESELWQDVFAPGIDTWIQDQQVAQAMGDYKQVIQAVSIDNFLVPSLIIIVFSFAFYGYALFGRKG